MLRTETYDDYEPTQMSRILHEHFAGSGADVIDWLERRSEYISLAPGEALFHQGAAGDDVYFVLSGRLRALTGGPGEMPRSLGDIGRGETIGELAFFTGETRSASVVALRSSSVARVSRLLIQQAIARNPEFALDLTRLVIQRFRQSENARPAVSVPANVCILPISPGLDAMAFAQGLRLRQPASLGSIAVVGAAQMTGTRGTGVTRRLGELEHGASSVYLVADADDTAWTRACLEHADEILLLADAAASPALSDVEAQLLSDRGSVASVARRSLVLLHDAKTRSPRHTAHWLTPRGRPRHFHIRPDLEADMARLARIVSGRAVGLVFAGGGARGFAHIGVYQALEEAGIPVDFVGGTSIGALMGTPVALDVRGPEVENGVREGFLKHPSGNITGDYNLMPLLSVLKGGRSRESLANSVSRFVGHDIDMEDSWKSFFVIASNFTRGREEVLEHGSLVDSVTASFSIPGALPPVLIDGSLMFDGGTFNNFPVDVMAEMGVGKVIGVDVSGERNRRLDIAGLPGPLAFLRDKLRPRAKQRYRGLPTIPETMLMSSFISSMSRQRVQARHVDLLFRPKLPRMQLLDWHRFDEAVAAGRSHAAEILGQMSKEALQAYR